MWICEGAAVKVLNRATAMGWWRWRMSLGSCRTFRIDLAKQAYYKVSVMQILYFGIEIGSNCSVGGVAQW